MAKKKVIRVWVDEQGTEHPNELSAYKSDAKYWKKRAGEAEEKLASVGVRRVQGEVVEE